MDCVCEISSTRVTFLISGTYLVGTMIDVRAPRSISRPLYICTTAGGEGENWATYCISLFALSSPSLLQNSSNVASSGACSLTLLCQGAPSCGPFGREDVFTTLLNVLPCFQDLVDSSKASLSARIVSSEGSSGAILRQFSASQSHPEHYIRDTFTGVMDSWYSLDIVAQAGVGAQGRVVEMRKQACEKRAVASLPTVVVFWEPIIRQVAVALQLQLSPRPQLCSKIRPFALGSSWYASGTAVLNG